MTATASIDYAQARFNMIEQQIRPWEVLDPAVLQLLEQVRREDFVPEHLKALAYADLALPLANGAAMLEPKIEARLLQELDPQPGERALLVGAGSGYVAALLAARGATVLALEIDAAQLAVARQNLDQAGVSNVTLLKGDGANGWPGSAPYDLIFIAGALPALSADLLEQLKPGGRLVAIVGRDPAMQALRVTRSNENSFNRVALFETSAALLQNAAPRPEFVF